MDFDVYTPKVAQAMSKFLLHARIIFKLTLFYFDKFNINKKNTKWPKYQMSHSNNENSI